MLKTRILNATYVWSAIVTVEVPNDATNEEQREALDKAAMGVKPDFTHPVLHSCDDNPELID